MKRLPSLSFPAISTNVAVLLLFAALVFTGCKFFGDAPSGPSSIERYFFDIQTNYVPRIALATNTVFLTNVVTQVQTNEVGVIVTHTNQIVIPTYSLITITQQVEAYTFTSKTNQPIVQGAGAIGNMVAPGTGGLIIGLLTAGLTAWGKLRSQKKTNTALAQNVETALELIEALPNGSKYAEVLKQFMAKDQAEQGVTKQVQKVLDNDVSNSEAKASVGEIKQTLSTFSGVDPLKPLV